MTTEESPINSRPPVELRCVIPLSRDESRLAANAVRIELATRGWRGTDLARATGLNYATITRLLRGECVSTASLITVCDCLNMGRNEAIGMLCTVLYGLKTKHDPADGDPFYTWSWTDPSDGSEWTATRHPAVVPEPDQDDQEVTE